MDYSINTNDMKDMRPMESTSETRENSRITDEITSYRIVSFYFFIALEPQKIEKIKEDLESFYETIRLRGLVILAPEGLNGTVACPEGLLEHFTAYLQEEISQGDWKFKYSHSIKAPYKRLSVKLREEIVTSGHPDLFPNTSDESHISAEEWHEVMEKEKEYFMIDVRNDYEVQLGTFKGAINPRTKDFKEFPDFIETCQIPKDQPVYICCTGGIRCEKAYLEMKQSGYEKVYQLDGGILTYMEKYPEGHFEGECFVFDDRVALDKNLAPSELFALCPHCGDPAKDFISCKNCGTEKKICASCQETEYRKTCSKNCAYHYGLKINDKRDAMTDLDMKNSNQVEDTELKSECGKAAFSLLKLLLIIFFIVSLPLFSFAEEVSKGQNAADTAREAVKKMQEKGDPSPIVDYVDWEHLYASLPDNNKKVMNVTTPEELKSFYEKVLESPSSQISGLLSEKIDTAELAGDKKLDESKVAEVLTKLENRLKDKEEQLKKRLKNSVYEVKESSVEGNVAKVNISHTYDGESKTDEVEMHKKDGKWFFTSLSKAFTGK